MLLLGGLTHAADWPQWLGPRRDNSAAEAVAPWADKPRLLWKHAVSEGHSAPIIAGGLAVLHMAGTTPLLEQVTAYDAATGERRWSADLPKTAFRSEFGTGPRSTPVAHDGRIFTLGVTGTVGVLDLATGKQLRDPLDTAAQFQSGKLHFGVSSSPLVDGGNLVTLLGGKADASLVAFDPQTLAVKWKSLPDAASYSSPIVISAAGHRQIVALTAEGVVAVSPADGTLLWREKFKDILAESSTTPVMVGDTLIASSVTLGSVALTLGSDNGKPTATQRWKNPQLSCYFSTPVAVGADHVYMVTGSLVPKAGVTLRCVEVATGKVLWSQPKVGQYHAALMRTADNKLLMLGDAGTLTLVDPSPAGYKELATATVCGHTWAHPVLVNGRLYLRDERAFFCFEMAKP